VSIGRDSELEVLRGSIRDVTAGSAATVVIEGEPGIGKTRLLEDLCTIAQDRGMRVFRGDAHPLERTRPFGAIVDALGIRIGSVDPRRAEIGQLLASREIAGAGGMPGGGVQFRVLEEIVELVEVLSNPGPVLVALDDLHWADSSTLLAFRWLMRRLTEAPLLLIGTVRPVPRTVELGQILDDARESGARFIQLHALDGSDVEALAELELGVPPGPALLEAVARAGGNPLWIVEMLRSMSAEGMLDLSQATATLTRAELPDSLREVIVRRVSYLSESTVATLRLASLLGDAFAVIDLAIVTGRRATDLVAELRDAVHGGLLADHGGTLAFRHQLVREAIYEDIPQAARFALHREAGRALESAGAPLVQVASQLILGALPGDVEAARSLRRAAQDAVLRAPGVACELLRRAETLLPDGHPERDVTLAELVEALFRAGQVTQAAGIAEQVLARSHDAGVDGPLRFGLIVALSIQGRTAELNRQIDVALSRSPDMPFAEQAPSV